ncbi:MAG TPA: hypothetical protein GXX58_02815 [Gelria sp.]|jgi:hypothetical protein|nr:hypothetical protein [Gelria sp.]
MTRRGDSGKAIPGVKCREKYACDVCDYVPTDKQRGRVGKLARNMKIHPPVDCRWPAVICAVNPSKVIVMDVAKNKGVSRMEMRILIISCYSPGISG